MRAYFEQKSGHARLEGDTGHKSYIGVGRGLARTDDGACRSSAALELFMGDPRARDALVDLRADIIGFRRPECAFNLHLLQDCIEDGKEAGQTQIDRKVDAGDAKRHREARIRDNHQIAMPKAGDQPGQIAVQQAGFLHRMRASDCASKNIASSGLKVRPVMLPGLGEYCSRASMMT